MHIGLKKDNILLSKTLNVTNIKFSYFLTSIRLDFKFKQKYPKAIVQQSINVDTTK